LNDINDVAIVPTAEDHIASLNRCLDVVARERLYVGLVESPSLARLQDFVRKLIAGGGVQFVAVDCAGSVLGWCDIVRPGLEGFRHCGRLGMGLLPTARGRGLGRRLAEVAIEAAFARGMERIELEVFASNAAAIALYRGLGLKVEGVKRRARLLDGRYDDNVLMALMHEVPDLGDSNGDRRPEKDAG